MANKKEFDLDKWKQQQDEMLESFEKDIKTIAQDFTQDPAKIADFLEFKSKFYNYSIRNTMLIQKQAPHSCFVESFVAWKKRETTVLKGSKAIKIFVPTQTELYKLAGDEKGYPISKASELVKQQIAQGQIKTYTKTNFVLGSVFDIGQTDYPKKDYPKLFDMGNQSQTHAELYDGLKAYSVQIGIPVIEKNVESVALRGMYNLDTNEIAISDKLNDTERLSTLTHELGHAVMHNASVDRLDKNKSVIEFEADCFSVLLQTKMGVELTDIRKSHLAEHYKKLDAEIDIDIMTTLQTANKVFVEFNENFEKNGKMINEHKNMVANPVELPHGEEVEQLEPVQQVKYSVRTAPFEKDGLNIKGFATVIINDSFCVNSIKICEGKNGLYVQMPSFKDNDGKYKDIAFPAVLRQELNEKILAEFKNPSEKPKGVDKAAKDAKTIKNNLNVSIVLIEGDKPIKGVATITINESFTIKRACVVEGKNGLYVQMPSYKKTDGEYEDIAFPTTKGSREQLNTAVLEKYSEVFQATNVKTMDEWQADIKAAKLEHEADKTEKAMEKQTDKLAPVH